MDQKYKILKSTLRIVLGLIFLWAFIDKLFGLGYATTAERAWLAGGSPTAGFLEFGTKGPFVNLFHALAGNVVVDWLFMLGLCGVGLALVFGVGVRIAGYSGAVMMLLIWLSILPPENNPFIDEHIVYALVLIWMTRLDQTKLFGLGRWWQQFEFVRKFQWLA